MGFVFQPRRLAQAAALSVLAGSCVALGATPAEAILTFYIFENSSNSNRVRLQAEGSLTLAAQTGATTNACSANGSIDFSGSRICAGSTGDTLTYSVAPTPNTGAFDNYIPALLLNAISSSPNNPLASPNNTPFVYLDSFSSQFFISPNYVSGTSISSFSDFSGTFSQLGFGTITGTLGTWTIGTGALTDTINVQFGAPPGPGPSPSTVPGPLPVVGGAAAFGWSRRLRRRIQA